MSSGCKRDQHQSKPNRETVENQQKIGVNCTCRQMNIGIASRLSSSVPVSPLVPRPFTKSIAPAGIRVLWPCMEPAIAKFQPFVNTKSTFFRDDST